MITFATVKAYQDEASCCVRVIYPLPEVFCRLRGALALTQLLNNRSMLSWLQKWNHRLHIKVLVWSSLWAASQALLLWRLQWHQVQKLITRSPPSHFLSVVMQGTPILGDLSS